MVKKGQKFNKYNLEQIEIVNKHFLGKERFSKIIRNRVSGKIR